MNIKALAENIDLEEHEYLELIEIFIQSSFSDLNIMQTGIKEQCAEKIAFAAHSLKGAAINLGLDDLYKTAKEIETKAHCFQSEKIPEAVKIIRKSLDHLNDMIKRKNTHKGTNSYQVGSIPANN
ncbi:MAG: Hpt domain-containing protein [Desulfobacterales bacterium]|nr:Hpt domain-containing protein [Desulfobacterales bacterium]